MSAYARPSLRGLACGSICDQSLCHRFSGGRCAGRRRPADLGPREAVWAREKGLRSARFPIDTLKIDRSFVAQIGEGTQASAIVAAVIAMANRLGITVVAEGVETEAQLGILDGEGCRIAQGPYFSPAVHPGEIEAMMFANGLADGDDLRNEDRGGLTA